MIWIPLSNTIHSRFIYGFPYPIGLSRHCRSIRWLTWRRVVILLLVHITSIFDLRRISTIAEIIVEGSVWKPDARFSENGYFEYQECRNLPILIRIWWWRLEKSKSRWWFLCIILCIRFFIDCVINLFLVVTATGTNKKKEN